MRTVLYKKEILTMKTLQTIKAVGSLAISIGVGSIVGDVISGNIKKPSNVLRKACIFLAAGMISEMVADKVTAYAEEKFDDTVDVIREIVNEKDVETDIIEE